MKYAYHSQRGEYYPERHAENLSKLGEKFPSYDSQVIDCLYRFSIHLDTYTQKLIVDFKMGKNTREECLGELTVIFYHFDEALREEVFQYWLDMSDD